MHYLLLAIFQNLVEYSHILSCPNLLIHIIFVFLFRAILILLYYLLLVLKFEIRRTK